MDFLVRLINFFFSVYYILLAVRAILPWFPHHRSHPLIKPIYDLTDPVLSPIKRGLPPLRIGMDVSPFIAIILLWIVQQVILYFLK